MRAVRELRIPADHPCLPGHFPGRPLIPAVIILQHAAAALTDAFCDCRISGIPQVKFLSPLAPDETAQMVLKRTAAGTVRFDCAVGERLIATGRFQVEGTGEHQ